MTHTHAHVYDCLRRVEEIREAHRALPDDAPIEDIVQALTPLAPARDALEDAVRALRDVHPAPDMPLVSPGIAHAQRSLATPPDHPAGINHPDNQWTTTVAELRKFADAGGVLGQWECMGLAGHWASVAGLLRAEPDGRYPVRVRRRP